MAEETTPSPQPAKKSEVRLTPGTALSGIAGAPIIQWLWNDQFAMFGWQVAPMSPEVTVALAGLIMVIFNWISTRSQKKEIAAANSETYLG